MFGWLAKKGEDTRVYMCIKEVKWDFENSLPVKRGMILALAQFYRNQVLGQIGVPEDIFDNPLQYRRSDLMGFYNILEDARNQSRLELDVNKKNMKNFGMELPNFAIDHANNTNRALEVWMCTLGAGISPDKRDDVREIWEMIYSARKTLPESLKQLRDIEKQTGEMTSQITDMFNGMNDQEWIDACDYLPSYFVKSFSVDNL